MTWKYFVGNCSDDAPERLKEPPACPPWRQFMPRDVVDQTSDAGYWDALHVLAADDPRSVRRGKTFQIPTDSDRYLELVSAVNAAVHLRRPLLVSGTPGSGKTSLAYAIAHELQLGPVLKWPITARSRLVDAEYRYDAIARLQDAQLDKSRQGEPDQAALPKEEGSLGDYITLGPVGTAFLPSLRPRVLLIDEIDKSDLSLPNELLNLFEEGEFQIPELVRRKRSRDDEDFTVEVRTADSDMTTFIRNGRVQCCEFPIIVMTSNGERDFPPAFYRRCLRVAMPDPTSDSLVPIVRSHFEAIDEAAWAGHQERLDEVIGQFLDRGNKADRATDQLLNAVYFLTRDEPPSDDEMTRLKKILLKRLSEAT